MSVTLTRLEVKRADGEVVSFDMDDIRSVYDRWVDANGRKPQEGDTIFICDIGPLDRVTTMSTDSDSASCSISFGHSGRYWK